MTEARATLVHQIEQCKLAQLLAGEPELNETLAELLVQLHASLAELDVV